MLLLRTGNLSVERIAAAARGTPPPDSEAERAQLAAWRAQGFDEVEDYVAWSVVEPERGRFDFAHHRANVRAARAAGLRCFVYAWAHAAPAWFRASPGFVPARCLEHGLAGPTASLFAPSTWEAAERFHRALAAELADEVDGLVIAFPADYGEVGFGSGMADWLLAPDPDAVHHHAGLWCGEDEARRAFAARGVAELPGPEAGPRERLAFARCYRGAVTEWTERLLALTRELWPGRPREIKLGHGSEELALGADYGAVVRAAARSGAVVRSTHSSLPELFTKRVASLCRTHGAAFATEAPREQSAEELAARVFVDAAHGTRSYFEFPEQHAAVRGRLEALRGAFGRARPAPGIALAYPELDLDLAPGLGVSETLALCHARLRRLVDFDLLDGRQLAGGALASPTEVRGLVWLDGRAITRDALAALSAWVRGGGVLVSGAGEPPVVLDADGGRATPGAAEAELLALLAPAPRPLPYVAADGPVPPATIEPGRAEHRPWLGAGWHGREDGAYAWPAAGAPVAARWSSPRATLLVPRPAGAEAELFVEAYARDPAPVRVRVDGRELGTREVRGAGALALPLDGARAPGTPGTNGASPWMRVELESPPVRSVERDERRALGLLVRAVGVRDDPVSAGRSDATEPRARIDARAAGEALARLGRGLVLRGDGTPHGALAWLRTWLAGEPSEPPAPIVTRDRAEGCCVTRLAGGVLVHDPSPRERRRAELAGCGSLRDERPLEPLETRWHPLPDPAAGSGGAARP